MLAGSLLGGAVVAAPSAGAASQPSLMPDGGQFVSVPITVVRSSTPLAAGASLAVPVAGTGDGVPSSADSVVVVIKTINAAKPGFVSAWNTDSGDSGVATVGLSTSLNAQQMETIPVGPSGSISLTNHSAGTASVSVRVIGYYTGGSTSTAGDTYHGVPWAEIADTSTGLGTSETPLAGGASRTIQVSGAGGIPAGADTAVVQINVFNSSSDGFLDIYPAGSSPSGLSALTYGPDGTTDRNMYYAQLSSSGAVTITNDGSDSVGFTLYTRGYFLAPSASPAGDEYTSFDPDMLYGSASAGTKLTAGASATIQASGDESIPASGVDAVSEDVIVTSSTGTGSLQTGTPGGTMHAAVNFLPTSDTYVGYDNSILTQLSPSGQEQITNSSDGTIYVQIAVVGFYQSPSQPAAPTSAAAAVSGTSATVTWAAPISDGGSPVTGYTVSASPDSATASVDGGTYTATLTGLASASSDTFTVTATNAVGTSEAATVQPVASTTVSGTVLSPSGTPVAGAPVNIYAADEPDPSATNWTPDLIGTATTDSSGNWSFTIPPYSTLPAAAQAAASNDGGTLNIDAEAYGQATANGNSYIENSQAYEPVWVGTGTPATPPAGVLPAAQQMTLEPAGPDNSSLDTAAAENQTYAATYGPADLNQAGTVADTTDDSPPPTDSYGYQSIGPDNNYNPSIAADGTNVGSVPVNAPQDGYYCRIAQTVVLSRWWQWTKVGVEHSGWNNTGDFWYGHGGSTAVGVEVSADGDHFGLSGHATWTEEGGGRWNWGSKGPNSSHYAYLAFNYEKRKQHHECLQGGVVVSSWWRWQRKITGLHHFSNGFNYEYGSSNLYSSADGPTGLAKINASHPGYVFNVRRGRSYSYNWSKTSDFGFAANVGGIGVDAETSLNTNTEQDITEKWGTRHIHRIWSWHGNPQICQGSCRLRVIQSY